MNNFNGFQRNQFSSYFNPSLATSASTNNIVWVQGYAVCNKLAILYTIQDHLKEKENSIMDVKMMNIGKSI